MKKILLINWRDIRNPEAGGAEVYYHEIFRRLAGAGKYAVTVLSHAFAGGAAEEDVDGTRVVRRGSRGLFNYAAARYARKHQREYDLVIEDQNKIPFYTPLYVSRPRLHLVMHYFGTQIFREVPFPLAAYVYANERLVPRLYRRERFVAISQSTAQEVRGFAEKPERVDVVEPGIDTDFFRPARPKEKEPLLVYVGRLKRYKNVQFILENLPAIARQVPAVRMCIAGAGGYEPALKALCKKLGLESRVSFAGYVSEEEKRDMLSRAHVLANTSFKEGWGITNIEAALCGTVSVSSDVPGLRDSVQNGSTGLLYRPGDRAGFVSRVARLLTDAPLRRKMEEAAVSFGRGFSWDAMTQKMEPCLIKALA